MCLSQVWVPKCSMLVCLVGTQTAFPQKERVGVLQCIQAFRSSFSSSKVGVRSEVKNNETVRLAMLQRAPLISYGEVEIGREDHMIYRQRRRRPARYEPTPTLKAGRPTIQDLHQNQHYHVDSTTWRRSSGCCCTPLMVERAVSKVGLLGHTYAAATRTRTGWLLSTC